MITNFSIRVNLDYKQKNQLSLDCKHQSLCGFVLMLDAIMSQGIFSLLLITFLLELRVSSAGYRLYGSPHINYEKPIDSVSNPAFLR